MSQQVFDVIFYPDTTEQCILVNVGQYEYFFEISSWQENNDHIIVNVFLAKKNLQGLLAV